jgi:hypothetical protein
MRVKISSIAAESAPRITKLSQLMRIALPPRIALMIACPVTPLTSLNNIGQLDIHLRQRLLHPLTRHFINETLLPKLERELADEARGNKHYLAGFECALTKSDDTLYRISQG